MSPVTGHFLVFALLIFWHVDAGLEMGRGRWVRETPASRLKSQRLSEQKIGGQERSLPTSGGASAFYQPYFKMSYIQDGL